MGLSSRFSSRWWIILVCAGGLAVAASAYRLQWQYSEPPSTFDIASLTFPVTVEGIQAGSPERLRFLLESWPPGTTLDIQPDDGLPQDITLALRQGPVSLILTGLGGMVFLAVAVLFFAFRYRQPGIDGFFWISFLYGLSIMVGGIYFPREDAWPVAFFNLVQMTCLAFLPVTFLRLALQFPRRSAVLDRHRWLLPTLFTFSGLLVLWQAMVFFRYSTAPGPLNEPALVPALITADLFLVTLTLSGVVLFAARSRHLEMTRDRDQVRWLLWGFAIGAAPYVFLRTLPQLVGLPTLMPPHVDRVIELAIPLSFVMAVVRHQFLDIDVIIRRSLLYGLLAASLLAVYLTAGVVFGKLLGTPQGMDPWILPVILGLGAGITFLPLRRALGGWIDRTFFKIAHDHDRTIDNLDRDLAKVADPESVGKRVLARVATALMPDHLTVVIRQGSDALVMGDLEAATATWALTAFPDTRIFLAAAPRSTSRPELERPDFPLDLLEEGVVLYQPLFQGEKVLGAILLGHRSTGRRYVAQDLTFLASCAGVADRHLERIALLQTVAEESLARKRLAELDRLKSEFLAQVAHDLRTPVAGITWSARNLLEGLVGELTPDQADYMGSIATSGAHLNRLVDNLLEISRLEEARQRLVLSEFQATEVWSEAMATVRPLAESKDVTLELVRSDEEVPLVRGHRDKMIEVTVNLLDNAVKYTAPGTVVTITVESATEDTLTMGLRDRGPGLRGQKPEELLGRFAQGEPSPHSSRKGFGLGLHIAATYIELMGGRLEAADHPDGGAVFTCILPLAGTPAGDPQQGDEP